MDVKKDYELREYSEDVLGRKTIYKEELNVILGVMFKVLSDLNKMPKRGSFAMSGQRRNCDSDLIVTFNFKKGKLRNDHYCSEDSPAVDLIGKVSSYKNRPEMGSIRSGFHSPKWMNLETNKGRFLCAVVSDGDNETAEAIYLILTKTFSLIGRGDETLQRCATSTFINQFEKNDLAALVTDMVEKIFSDKSLPEIKEFEDFRAELKFNNELRPFFA